ncbi:MAG TPA: hypothetical protein VHE35_15505 [Kofleriaceae bacterium]|nr:hypothetical protein [Kofleriaceae bacterium]
MPFPGFELACVAIVALTLAAMARVRPWRALLADYAALAVAGWIGEETCVAWYDFYGYSPAWHGRLDRVPVLIPLIWPLVILSARAVVDAVSATRPRPVADAVSGSRTPDPEVSATDPRVSATPPAGTLRASHHALLVGALVAFDASLVEVIAVRAKLWAWAEPGHLGVPVLGILGWGFFAACADVALGLRHRLRHLALVPALAATHLLILAAWWGVFRWTVRGPLGDASLAGLAAIAAVALAAAAATRLRGRALPLDVALPRMVAATLFVATLAVVASADHRLWLHTALVAAPYLAVTDFAPRRRTAS